MDKVTVCLDPGSCHMGRLEYAVELVELAIEAGADYIKFQMGTHSPNIPLDRNFWPILKFHAGDKIGLTASAFTEDTFNFLLEQNVPFMKFAFSQKNKLQEIRTCLDRGIRTVVSCDVLTQAEVPDECIKLFCLPMYPVPFQVDIREIMATGYFDGFSDHSLGWMQSYNATLAGARWIEKHFTLNRPDIICPDHYFSVRPKDVIEMVKELHKFGGDDGIYIGDS
jgi:N,N'-diacetyllegionaminate synthase